MRLLYSLGTSYTLAAHQRGGQEAAQIEELRIHGGVALGVKESLCVDEEDGHSTPRAAHGQHGCKDSISQSVYTHGLHCN